jgi:hypothetical protein
MEEVYIVQFLLNTGFITYYYFNGINSVELDLV